MPVHCCEKRLKGFSKLDLSISDFQEIFSILEWLAVETFLFVQVPKKSFYEPTFLFARIGKV